MRGRLAACGLRLPGRYAQLKALSVDSDFGNKFGAANMLKANHNAWREKSIPQDGRMSRRRGRLVSEMIPRSTPRLTAFYLALARLAAAL
jgi:hypothetical protein